MDVWDAIRTKRAVRKFTDQPLPQEVAERILDAGRRSQSSKNTQPWHFIAVRDHVTLEALSKTGDFMGHVAGSALCVVMVTASDGAAKVMFDVGQTAAYMQLAAQGMGVGSCLGTIYHPDQVRTLLGHPADMQATFVISFGYPAPDPERRGAGKAGRRAFDEVVHWDRW
jgi:nitroreductase